MKILHTSDWHIGQNLMFQDRSAEHEQFLLWLTHLIQKETIDLVIVAGDIFDTATPPNYALKLYFQFLASLKNTACKDIIIIAGNHDSAAVLNAPKQLLKALNIHVIAGVSDTIEDQIIIAKSDKGAAAAMVCAVPFLRDHEIRKSLPGESFEDKNRAMAQGIKAHYEKIETLALKQIQKKGFQNIPLVATGHLFAAGGKIREDEHLREIHVGSIEKFNIAQLPKSFGYVALGHLHNCQKVSNKNHIRYSGSPIPLSFGEADTTKIVLKIEFLNSNTSPKISEIKIPLFQELVRFKGSLENILSKMARHKIKEAETCAWAEFIITDGWTPMAEEKIRKESRQLGFTVFAIKKERLNRQSKITSQARDLDYFSPRDIFKKRLALEKDPTACKKEDLILAFDEILTLVQE
ncbi:MAG: exonuclease subunit SbcD, partial [Desulfobacteraceae bacterium]|nr:exonuclease subunit SbcD [Desulfobacteraceae bacterium]